MASATLRHTAWILRGNPLTAVAAAGVTFLILIALLGSSIAPYDPILQYRSQPDCPPMALHLTPPAERQHGWLFAYPMKIVNPLARKFVEDHGRGHFFTECGMHIAKRDSRRDGRMAQQNFVDFVGSDVLASTDDDVLDPAG